VNGLGRIRRHLPSSASMCAGPRLSQISCNTGTSSQEQNPLSSGSKPIPALVAWGLAHSLPLMHSLAV
jgi:hypothetical protein